ncbi:MAG: flagellar hook-length control protein FliK [Lachnospiraceae bacterium]|nr:flagellar hook-length control protein FliK [Lachnospiraceae bacterium]
MNINDILTNTNQIFGNNIPVNGGEQPSVRLNAADALLADLKAGDSIRAQVVSKDGNTITLSLPGGAAFDAKLSGAMNLELGKLLTFEVRSSTKGLMLSPLFTNMATDPNISKALNMAGLPVTSDTVEMTRQMMQSGMSVDRASLQNVFKDVSMYGDSSITDIVDLHRLGIDVNETNLSQIDSYKNLSYQLGEGMSNVLSELEGLIDGKGADLSQSARLLSHLADIAADIGKNGDAVLNNTGSDTGAALPAGQIPEGETVQSGDIGSTKVFSDIGSVAGAENDIGAADGETAPTETFPAGEKLSAAERALRLLSSVSEERVTETSNPENKTNAVNSGLFAENQAKAVNAGSSGAGIQTAEGNITRTGSENVADRERIPLDDAARLTLAGELEALSDDKVSLSGKSLPELFNITKSIIDNAIKSGDSSKLERLLGNNVIKDSIFSAISEQWSISPSDVAEKEKVMELYSKLNKQLITLKETLEEAGLKNTPAGESAANMSNNLDFLNQVNQMYSYIQLPIKLSGGDRAHGDLYVYSNGKKLNMKDGKVSALLHLDMEHLGPVDVYVAMDTASINRKVSTQFYVADESILDFLEEHMDELTARIEAKGYSVSAKTSVKGSPESRENPISDAAEGGGINGILSQTGSRLKLAEYSFDVRT